MVESQGFIDASEICEERSGPEPKAHAIITEYPDYDGVYAVELCDYCGLIAGKWTYDEYVKAEGQERENDPTFRTLDGSDAYPCADCGEDTIVGEKLDGDFLCEPCAYQRKDYVAEVGPDETVLCECGTEVRFRSMEGVGYWMCHVCGEAFQAKDCPECGQQACIVPTTAGAMCNDCLRGDS